MAKAEIQMPEDFLRRLSQLGAKSDEIAESVLVAGGEVMVEGIRTKLEAVVGRDTKYPTKTTGELGRALGMTKVRVDRNGNHNIKVGFAEPRADGGSNAKLANILEYGKHGQPAKPFLKPAKTASKKICEAAMKQKFEDEVSKI